MPRPTRGVWVQPCRGSFASVAADFPLLWVFLADSLFLVRFLFLCHRRPPPPPPPAPPAPPAPGRTLATQQRATKCTGPARCAASCMFVKANTAVNTGCCRADCRFTRVAAPCGGRALIPLRAPPVLPLACPVLAVRRTGCDRLTTRTGRSITTCRCPGPRTPPAPRTCRATAAGRSTRQRATTPPGKARDDAIPLRTSCFLC